MSNLGLIGRLRDPDYIPLEDQRAQRAAMKAIARDIPDPRRMARYLPLTVCQALLTAERCCRAEHRGFWQVAQATPAPLLRDLRSWGLVYAGAEPLLTIQGKRVRAELLEQDG